MNMPSEEHDYGVENLRIIITAAGKARRWGNHLNVPKHLAPVPAANGETETLLRRLTRQARELGVKDIVIVSPPDDPRYETEGARLYPRAVKKRWFQSDRFMTPELWNKDGRTLYIPGDLYATDEAMRRMIVEPLRDWIWYMRLTRDVYYGVERSRATFGFGFWPEHHDFLLMTMKYVNALERNPASPVRRSLGVDIYRAMAHESPEDLARTKGDKVFRDYPPHLVKIMDETTDIDSVAQYQHLMKIVTGEFGPDAVSGMKKTTGSLASKGKKTALKLASSVHALRAKRRVSDLTSELRVIITAGGNPRSQRYWKNHLDRPKHLVQIPPGGETLLQRTVRLLRESGVEDVVLVRPDFDIKGLPDGLSYDVDGARMYRKPSPKSESDILYRHADRYMPRELWNPSGRTLFIPGDMYFSKQTLADIIAYDPDTWVMYLRLRTTEWPKGQPGSFRRTRMVLGFGFPAHEHDYIANGIEALTAMQRDPENPVDRSLGLDIYRYFLGQTPEQLSREGSRNKALWKAVKPHAWQPPVDSPEVDFDTAETYEAFIRHYDPALHD